jgi:hypothetical protein|tara:strand:+ start:129 stop:443 length:315 start_codon:yes stop_codon:yes gene_type:complete
VLPRKSLNSLGTVEEFIDGDGDTFHVKKTFDVEPTLNSAAELRSNGMTGTSEFRHIGRLDLDVYSMWLKEAGVTWDDTKAAEEVVRKKLMDGDFNKFRVYEGAF